MSYVAPGCNYKLRKWLLWNIEKRMAGESNYASAVDVGILVTRSVSLLVEERIKLDHDVDDIPFLNSICSDFVLAKEALITFLIFKTPENREEVHPLLY